MLNEVKRFTREIRECDGKRLVKVGSSKNKYHTSCLNIPSSVKEAREKIRELNEPGKPYDIGAGDQYILDHECELHYYDELHKIFIIKENGYEEIKDDHLSRC